MSDMQGLLLLVIVGLIAVAVMVLMNMYGWRALVFPIAVLRGHCAGDDLELPFTVVCPYREGSWRRDAWNVGWDVWWKTNRPKSDQRR